LRYHMENLLPHKRERERGGEKFQRLVKKVLRIAMQLLLLSLLLFASHSVYDQLLEDPYFCVKEVEIKGCQKIPQEYLLGLAQIEGMPNLFTIALGEVSKRLESHPWIEEVRVRKIFPNKIFIQVEERKPVAILQLEDPYYIDNKGVIFAPVGDRDGYNYPFLTGLTRQTLEREPEESKRLIMKALELLENLKQRRVSPLEEISEIHMEKAFGIECFTKNEGIGVRMGWDRFGEKLRRLSIVWSDLRKRGITPVSIDCTDLKKMVVKNPS
jgi:cell division protein FtsQ